MGAEAKRTVLLLTGLNKDGRKEDEFIASCLKRSFNVIISDLHNSQKFEDDADLVLIRNIWPTRGHLVADTKVLYRLIKKGIKTYNPGVGEDDLIGKDYLVYLFRKGLPVIPSINEKEDIPLLGEVGSYFIKPKHGGSREGCKTVSKKGLHSVNLDRYIAQPHIDFKYELSFYFIDDKLQYALYAPDKKRRWRLRQLKVSRKDVKFAKKFVEFNKMPYGMQRIDACRLKDGRLLLIEIEDWCPYLSLLDITPALRNKFMKSFVASIKKAAI
jgi:hypothetical protein